MIAGILVVLAAGTGGGAPPPAAALNGPALLPVVQSAERLPLPRNRGPLAVEVDPLAATVAIFAPRDLAAVAARVRDQGTQICPHWEVQGSRLVFHCRTRRLEAGISEEGGQRFLDIRELRGLPREGPDDRLELFYDPLRAGLGGPCPGTTPAGRGECAFMLGNRAEAQRQWLLAFETNDRAMASLRMGDLALADGAYGRAIGWWKKAGTVGPFGRMAAARLCELTGSCLHRPISRIFEGGELAQPMRTELLLRGARIDVYLGRTREGLARISDLIARRASGGGCVTIGERMCRRLVLAALEDRDAATARQAVEVYLTLPNRFQGPYAIELGRAAADRAWQLGAPIFAANLYAAVAALVPAEELAGHLLHTAELYLAGEDRARAQLIFDYSEAHFEAKRLQGSRWAMVRKRLSGPGGFAAGQRERIRQILLTTEAVRDLAGALSTLARSKAITPGM